MRVTRTERAEGATYRVYRASGDFAAKVKALIPFILEVPASVLIGDTWDDPRLVITVEPLSQAAEQEFLGKVGPYLAGA